MGKIYVHVESKDHPLHYRRFSRMKKAREWAAVAVGHNPNFSHGAAIARDGSGAVTANVPLKDLFPHADAAKATPIEKERHDVGSTAIEFQMGFIDRPNEKRTEWCYDCVYIHGLKGKDQENTHICLLSLKRLNTPNHRCRCPDIDVCPRCGGECGEPGSNFGDTGWMPCYHCGETGYIKIKEVKNG